MAAKRKNKGRLKIGELYQWQPKQPTIAYEYTMYLGNKENVFVTGFEDHFTVNEAVMPLEVYRGRGNDDTQYRILTTGGKIGWISIDDCFVNDWIKVTKPL
jgi:hypothetical protein